MTDQLNNFPALADIYSSLESVFNKSIIESGFEKEELSVKIKKEDLLAVLKFFKQEKCFNVLNDIIALDNSSSMKEGQKRFSILYQLYRFPDLSVFVLLLI